MAWMEHGLQNNITHQIRTFDGRQGALRIMGKASFNNTLVLEQRKGWGGVGTYTNCRATYKRQLLLKPMLSWQQR